MSDPRRPSRTAPAAGPSGVAGSAGESGPRILLVGMMGAGKTTVGTAIAARTGWPYLDNDVLVEQATGRPTRDVLATADEPTLRAVEAAALDVALQAPPPVVAGVAAGVVVDPAARQRLRDGAFVVYLRAPVEVLATRVGDGADRPWLGDDPLAALTRLSAGREPLYLDVADLVLDVDELSAGDAASRVLAALPA